MWKSNKVENPKEIDISNENLSISVLSGYRESLSIATPDQQRILRKNKRKKNSRQFFHNKRNYSKNIQRR